MIFAVVFLVCPPAIRSASRTITFLPCFLRKYAVSKPAIPAPITAASVSLFPSRGLLEGISTSLLHRDSGFIFLNCPIVPSLPIGSQLFKIILSNLGNTILENKLDNTVKVVLRKQHKRAKQKEQMICQITRPQIK